MNCKRKFSTKEFRNATVYGAEIEFRKNISEKLSLMLMHQLLNLNKICKAEQSLRTLGLRSGETLDGSRELQGQSPYLINTSIDYRDDTTRAGFYFYYVGENFGSYRKWNKSCYLYTTIWKFKFYLFKIIWEGQ